MTGVGCTHTVGANLNDEPRLTKTNRNPPTKWRAQKGTSPPGGGEGAPSWTHPSYKGSKQATPIPQRSKCVQTIGKNLKRRTWAGKGQHRYLGLPQVGSDKPSGDSHLSKAG